MIDDLLREHPVERRTVFQGRLLTVHDDTVETADGNLAGREIIEHPGAVAIVATDADGRVVLVRQWRHAIGRAVETLRARQPLFARSGGCHAASLVDFDGEHLVTFEDVGRHNAVDKVVGACLLARRLPASKQALIVSGRTSFEIVQKAVVAGIPIVVGVSASSSLAVDVARRAGSTLVGFARGPHIAFDVDPA